ncbi:hypothetical protein ScPMuIL_016508 [Solemya velum]
MKCLRVRVCSSYQTIAFSRLNRRSEVCVFLLVIICRISSTVQPTTGDQTTEKLANTTFADKTIILQDQIDACGPDSLCDQNILLTSNISSVDSKYCSICSPCFCDELCYLLFDCCIDIQLNITSPRSNSGQHPQTSFVCVNEVRLRQDLVSVVAAKDTYPLVIECPENFTDFNVKQKCETPSPTDLLQLVPVTSTQTGISYRNVESLKCHGQTQHSPWDMKFDKCDTQDTLPSNILSSSRDILEDALENLLCDIFFLPNSNLDIKRTCSPTYLIHTCKMAHTDPNAVWACGHFYLAVDPPYNNMLCRGCRRAGVSLLDKCNGKTSKARCGVQLTDQEPGFVNPDCHVCNENAREYVHCPIKRKDDSRKPRVFLGFLFDMTSLFGSLKIGREDHNICGDMEVFDPYKAKCRQLFCPLGYYFKGDKCEPVRKGGYTCAYRLFFRLSPADDLFCGNACQLLGEIQPAVLANLQSELSTEQNVVFTTFNTSTQENRSTSESSGQGDNSVCSSNEIFVSIDLLVWPVKSTERAMTEYILLKARESTYNISNDTNRHLLKAYIDDASYSVFQVGSDQTGRCMLQTTEPLEIGTPYFTVSPLLECRQVELEKDEYQVINGYSIFVPTLRDTLGVSQYFVIGVRARVCLEDYIDVSVFNEFKTPSDIILYLTRTSCCRHMHRTFCCGTATTRFTERESKHLKQYLLYTLGVPALIVTITVVTNVFVSGSSNYKSNGIVCFITETISRGVAFILPVSALLVWNMVAFICTVRKVKSNPSLPNGAGYQHHVGCFVKLFTLTGLAWILSLLDASLEYVNATYSILSIVITILNSSHGVFIFFAFICNSRVYYSYKELILRLSRNSTNANNEPENNETRF